MKNVVIMLLTMLLVTVGSVRSVDRMAYVINTSGETLSKINLTSGVVFNNILTLGTDLHCYPNQIVVRGNYAYVIMSGTDEIQIIDLEGETTVNFITTGNGSNPFWMAFVDSQYAYVTNMMNNSLAKVDVISRTVVDEVYVGMSPEGVIIYDAVAYVAITAYDFSIWDWGQGKVVAYDTEGDSVLAEINVGKNPQYLAVDANGLIHVVCTGDYYSAMGQVYRIDPLTNTVVDSMATGGSPGQLTISPDGIAYVAAGGWYGTGYVYSYNSITAELFHGVANPIAVDSGCLMAVAYQDSSCFTGSFEDYVKPIDSGGSPLASYAVGDGPIHIDFNYQPGDMNGSFGVNISDLTYFVAYLFSGGAKPRWPVWRANINGDASINIADLTYLVSFLFSGGTPPQVSARWVR